MNISFNKQCAGSYTTVDKCYKIQYINSKWEILHQLERFPDTYETTCVCFKTLKQAKNIFWNINIIFIFKEVLS